MAGAGTSLGRGSRWLLSPATPPTRPQRGRSSRPTCGWRGARAAKSGQCLCVEGDVGLRSHAQLLWPGGSNNKRGARVSAAPSPDGCGGCPVHGILELGGPLEGPTGPGCQSVRPRCNRRDGGHSFGHGGLQLGRDSQHGRCKPTARVRLRRHVARCSAHHAPKRVEAAACGAAPPWRRRRSLLE